jgi:predicted GNAT family acetyltransferase
MPADRQKVRLENGSGRSRYVYDLPDGSEAVLDFFEVPAGVVTIDHTETPAKYRNQGIGGALVAHAIDDFRAAGKKVIPACPFAYREFRLHPEWADLLVGGG